MQLFTYATNFNKNPLFYCKKWSEISRREKPNMILYIVI